jgi:hypothetical protein|tara:strand:- start:422 stop:799 length:378 start_codon:yes stop_codon:yes gene_type:complete
MAYYDTINLVSGDDKPELNFTLRDSNTAATGKVLNEDDATTWAPIDLTSQTVRVKFRSLGGDTILDTMTCGKSAPYTDGKCFMQWNDTTLDVEAGTYEGEIELESSSGDIQTIFDKLKFKVRADF